MSNADEIRKLNAEFANLPKRRASGSPDERLERIRNQVYARHKKSFAAGDVGAFDGTPIKHDFKQEKGESDSAALNRLAKGVYEKRNAPKLNVVVTDAEDDPNEGFEDFKSDDDHKPRRGRRLNDDGELYTPDEDL